MTATMTPARPDTRTGRDGFAGLLHAEWTKFSTVRGWVLGMAATAVAIVVVGLIGTGASNLGSAASTVPIADDGRAVTDNFYFVHQSLTGDGSITVPVSLSGRIDGTSEPQVVPWAKAGLIVKDSLTQGSAYAAIMVTGSHGVRMQDNYFHDVAGLAGATSADAPRWLRLVRSGDLITGYDSSDGSRWTRVGTARLTGLASTAQIGMFASSPMTMSEGDNGASFNPAVGIGTFGSVGVTGGWTSGPWKGEKVGRDAGASGSYSNTLTGGFTESNGAFTVTGAGDIAPAVAGTGPMYTLENFLVGAFAGLIVLIVIGTSFITSEYRFGLIHTTFAASPRRGRVLMAKSVVLGSVAFGTGVLGAAVAVLIGPGQARSHGFAVIPVPMITELRVIVGTGLLLAVAAIFALAVGALLRRSATAATLVIAVIILPYVLAVSRVLPTVPSEWLLRVSPAAGFSVQQSLQRYDQVLTTYTPAAGYYPLAPWVGFAVLCVYTAIALAAATIVLRRRDA